MVERARRDMDERENLESISRRPGFSRNYGGSSDYAWSDFEPRGAFGAGYYLDRDYDYGDTTDSYVQPWLTPGPMTGRGPLNYRRPDESIWDEVNYRLYQHGDVDARDIEVQVQNGEVTLSGTVSDRRQKRLAEYVTDDVPGVRDVHNRLLLRNQNESQSNHGGITHGNAS